MVPRTGWLAEERQCLGVTCVHISMPKAKCSEVGLRGGEHSAGALASGHWEVGTS